MVITLPSANREQRLLVLHNPVSHVEHVVAVMLLRIVFLAEEVLGQHSGVSSSGKAHRLNVRLASETGGY
jgi:hypothetical protein